MTKTERAIEWMISHANDSRYGYNQQYRWGEYGDYDCSSAVITAWKEAGVDVTGAINTGSMYEVFKKAGFVDVTDSVNLSTGEGLIRGDVLLNHYAHTAMYCGDCLEVEASISENGGVIADIAGDQTGREFWVRPYRNYPWHVILRYPEKTQNKVTEDIVTEVIRGNFGNGEERKNRLEQMGYDYNEVQAKVNARLSHNQNEQVQPNIRAVAFEVIKGNWGNGDERKKRLEDAGFDYYEVQTLVNEILGV